MDNSSSSDSSPKPKSLGTREFHANPGEAPCCFRPVVRSPESDHIEISTPEMLQTYSIDTLLNIFNSKDPLKIDTICHQLTALIQHHEHLQSYILSCEKLVTSINDSVSCINSPEFASSFTMFVLSLFEHESTQLIDEGIFFSLRDLLATYPDQLLTFYHEVPFVSTYARNAMVCSGIVSDIIAYTQENNSCSGAHVLQSVFRCEEKVVDDDLESILPSIVSLLGISNEKAVYYVILAVINILRRNHNFISLFYDLKIHDYIAKLLPIPTLTRCCVYMIGNVAICETMGISHLIRTGTVTKLLELATVEGIASGAYWALSNCVKSSPIAVLPLIPVEFLKTTLDMLNTTEDGDTKKDCVFFLASLLLFSPNEKFHIIVSKEILANIIAMLDSESDCLVCRCLDALGRVLFVGMTNQKMKFVIQLICESPELNGHVERLTKSENTIIRNKGKTFLSEINKKRKELSSV